MTIGIVRRRVVVLSSRSLLVEDTSRRPSGAPTPGFSQTHDSSSRECRPVDPECWIHMLSTIVHLELG
jgi:hypothetical protein